MQLPKTTVAMTEKAAVALAVTRAHALGINPGGEVATIGPISHADLVTNVPVEDRERLLSTDEVNGP